MRRADEEKGLESPVFVLGCSTRCGSTLVQRLLCTVDGLMLWGENQAIAGLLADISERLRSWEAMSERQRDGFRAEGGQAWIANMGPPIDRVDELVRDWLLGFYGPATRALGKRRWGFKEVRHDARVADFLVKLFPAGRVILLVRNPIDVVASIHSTPWYEKAGGADGLVGTWCARVESFLEAGERHTLLRYEDLVDRPDDTLARLEAALSLRPGAIDRAPLDVVVVGPRGRSPQLDRADVRALRQPEVVEVAARCGYDLAADPRLTKRGVMGALFTR